MDLCDQTGRVKFMIRDRGSAYSTALDAILADTRIRIVLCHVRTALHERDCPMLIGGRRHELLDRTRIWNQAHLPQILHAYKIYHNRHRPHPSLHAAAPLKPLPEPVDLEQ